MLSLFDDIDPRSAACDFAVAQLQTRLRLAVADSGLKQRDVAKLLNVKPAVVSRWLSGRINIGVRSLASLAWAIGFELDIDFVHSTSGVRVSKSRAHAKVDFYLKISAIAVPAIPNTEKQWALPEINLPQDYNNQGIKVYA